MDGYDPGRYGRVVGDYDMLYPGDPAETKAAVRYISELAKERPERSVIEFGIGTGRLALGILEAGVSVSGIDGSRQMVDALRAKARGDEVSVQIGDYRVDRVPGTFSVVVLVLNGIFDPRGLDAQLDIFRNAARHLGTGGYFVVESWVMNDGQRSGDWSVVPRYVGDSHVELQLARYDIATNSIERTLVHFEPAGTRFITVADTYAAPGELDIMAKVSGFERASRFSSWAGADFNVSSSVCISVFRRVFQTGLSATSPDRE